MKNMKIISDEEMGKYAKATIKIMDIMKDLEPEEQLHIVTNIKDVIEDETGISLFYPNEEEGSQSD